MIVQELQYKDQRLEIIQDSDAQSPRDWDCLGIMAYQYRDYTLGDEEIKNGFTWDDYLESKDLAVKDLAVCMPLYVYEHSGISMTCGDRVYPFNDRWDSSMVGFIYVTKEKLKKEYSVKRLNKKIISRAESVLKSEVDIFNDYISGEIYGYNLEGKFDDSCFGFYGYDCKKNGIAEAVKDVTGIDFEKFEEI